MKQALLIIDMQQGSFTTETPRHDAVALVVRLNRLAESVRRRGGAVIFIQHDGPEGDAHHPSLPGWRLLRELEAQMTDTVIRKRSCDAFLDSGLDAFLTQSGVEQLIVTGCATDYCVDTTIRSALARRWPTIVPSDGHTTSDRPHLPATKIIEHHNAIWADFIAPAGPAVIRRCAELL